MASKRRDPKEFEREVRRLAHLIWAPHDEPMPAFIDGRERDCVLETRDERIIIEATLDRKEEKLKNDINKTLALIKRERRSTTKQVRAFIIIGEEPSQHQAALIQQNRNHITFETFHRFQSRIFDGVAYLAQRDKHRFGSILNPEDMTVHLDWGDFIEVPYIASEDGTSLSIDEVVTNVLKGARAVIVGDFGIGKSMGLREIYRRLSQRYRDGQIDRVPLFINLREHTGQSDPVEVLERHARLIGYRDASDLVRAWRAGYLVLILDGFDEMANPGWGRSLALVREYRNSTMKVIRRFIQESLSSTGVIIAGRSNYFDSPGEMRRALDVDERWLQLTLDEFGPKEIEYLFRQRGIAFSPPGWLPSRPLLLTYWAAQIVAATEKSRALVGESPDHAWNDFIDLICRREATQDQRLTDESVRQVIEHLATIARRSDDGLGNLSVEEIRTAFRDVVGFYPEEISQAFLLRLPGLRPSISGDGSRSFIDADYADALRAGDMSRFAINPYAADTTQLVAATYPLGRVGRSVLRTQLAVAAVDRSRLEQAAKRLHQVRATQIAVDLMFCATSPPSNTQLSLGEAEVHDIAFDRDDFDLSNVIFSDSLFHTIVVADDFDTAKLPKLERCIVGELYFSGEIEGIRSRLPSTEVERHVQRQLSTDHIMSLSLPTSVRVLGTILKKLFFQSGRGRELSALRRGLDQSAQAFVGPIIEILVREKIAFPAKGEDILLPNQRERGRAGRILKNLSQSKDQVVVICRAL